jgi:hypothetical protein
VKRLYMAPTDDQRCEAQVYPLSDKSTARCMKRIDQQHCRVCRQHRKMFRDGKPLVNHVTGQPMDSIIRRDVK